ncbi:MAG: Na(+)-translocating NADH-quinone reductase subunit C [bacterium]|nr:Na(+)-translocating NADH-quinone reductase subunit C [bacterium]
MEHSTRHTVIFTTLLCVVFSVVVSTVAVSLHDRQEENKRLDRIKNVLGVAGLAEPGERLSPDDLNGRFESGLEPVVVEMTTGQGVGGIDPLSFDQRKAAKDPERSRPAEDNRAKVRRVPNHAVVYLIKEGDQVTGFVLPIEGYGLWSTLYGYLAIEADLQTVKGITFYAHGETPGLGGEVDNVRWKARWPGRQVFDAKGTPMIRVKKGPAGTVEEDPFQVDGLSGATLTSNGVTNMIKFWLGRSGFGPYLAELRKQGETG